MRQFLTKLRQTMCRAWRAAAAVVLLAMLSGATCPAADTAPVADAGGAGATPVASATLADAAAAPSRLLSLMPEAWLPARPADPAAAAVARPEPSEAGTGAALVSLEAALDDAAAAQEDRGSVQKGIEILSKAGPWRGEIGVAAGTHDYWETWLTAERDIIPDRFTFGFSTSTGRYPYCGYPYGGYYGGHSPWAWNDAWR